MDGPLVAAYADSRAEAVDLCARLRGGEVSASRAGDPEQYRGFFGV